MASNDSEVPDIDIIIIMASRGEHLLHGVPLEVNDLSVVLVNDKHRLAIVHQRDTPRLGSHRGHQLLEGVLQGLLGVVLVILEGVTGAGTYHQGVVGV